MSLNYYNNNQYAPGSYAYSSPYKITSYNYNVGLESSPVVDLAHNKLRVVYRAQTYINPNYAPGGSLYGTVNYPFVNTIGYHDCDLDAFVAAVTGNSEIPWSKPTTLITSALTPGVSLDTNGITHVTVSPGSSAYDYFTDYTLDPVTGAATAQGNFLYASSLGYSAVAGVSLVWNINGTVDAFFVKYTPTDPTWRTVHYRGASLATLVYVDNSTPLSATRNIGGHNYSLTQYDTQGMVGSELWYFKDGVVQSPVLTLAMLKPPYNFGSDSQMADFNIFEHGGRTFCLFDILEIEKFNPNYMGVIWWDDTYSKVLSGYAEISTTTTGPTTTGAPTTTAPTTTEGPSTTTSQAPTTTANPTTTGAPTTEGPSTTSKPNISPAASITMYLDNELPLSSISMVLDNDPPFASIEMVVVPPCVAIDSQLGIFRFSETPGGALRVKTTGGVFHLAMVKDQGIVRFRTSIGIYAIAPEGPGSLTNSNNLPSSTINMVVENEYPTSTIVMAQT
jgi:hypothetical protein